MPTPGKYRPSLGIYTRPGLGGWMLRLEWRDGKLTFVAPEMALWQLVLEPTSNSDVFIAEPGSGFPGENVIFRRRADGRVTSVLLVESTFVRLDHVPASA